MLHDPCRWSIGEGGCLKGKYCSRKLPKPFSSHTTIDNEGYPTYRRTDNGIFVDRAILGINLLTLFSKNKEVNEINLNNVYVNPKKVGSEETTYRNFIKKISLMNSQISSLKIEKLWDTVLMNDIIAEKINIDKDDKNLTLNFELLNYIKFRDKITYKHVNQRWTSQIAILNDNLNLSIDANFDDKTTIEGQFVSSSFTQPKIIKFKTFCSNYPIQCFACKPKWSSNTMFWM